MVFLPFESRIEAFMSVDAVDAKLVAEKPDAVARPLAVTVVPLIAGELTEVDAERLPLPSIVAAVTNATPPVTVASPVPFFNTMGLAVAVVYALCVTAVSGSTGRFA